MIYAIYKVHHQVRLRHHNCDFVLYLMIFLLITKVRSISLAQGRDPDIKTWQRWFNHFCPEWRKRNEGQILSLDGWKHVRDSFSCQTFFAPWSWLMSFLCILLYCKRYFQQSDYINHVMQFGSLISISENTKDANFKE